MRYHIDTIPVWDALREAEGCPLCALRARTEALLTDRFLGGSVMEPDTRVQVNRMGFCSRHHRMLYAKQNRLGHALMTHTHLKEARSRYEAALRAALGASPARLFRGRSGGSLDEAARAIEEDTAACILCSRLNEDMQRYAYTLAWMHANEASFAREFRASRGVCMPDTALLLRAAKEALNNAQQQELVRDLLTLSEQKIAEDEADLEWFTLKFDYRNREKPWNNSRDALERCVNRLRGNTLGQGPEENT